MMGRKVLLLTLALLAGLTIGQGQIGAHRESGVSWQTKADVPYWPSFGYDPQNTSRSPHPGPQTGQIAWTYEAPKGRVINNQPTVDADGTVYFGTWGSYVEGSERAHGLLYAVNPDGTQKWVYDPGGPDPESYYLGTIETSATIGPAGTIYIGRGDGVLRAVNPDGSEKWRFETYSNQYGRVQIFTSPVIAEDGTVYFGTGVYKVLLWTLGTNVLYALNPDGSVKWTYPADAAEGGSLNHQIFMNPALGHDGTVYFSSGFTTYAINPDGTERWRKTTIRNMWNTAVGGDGTVYVQAMYQAGGTGAIYALNSEDGSRKWVYAVAEPTVTKVAIAGDGTLYLGSGTHGTTGEPQNVGKLYAIVDCGQDCVEEKWAEPVDFGSSVGAPTIDSEGIIYVALRGDLGAAGAETDPPVPGRVVAVRDTGTGGEELWSVQANGEIWQGNPVIGPNRTLYFADAVCIHDPETGVDCDEDTQIPSLYAVVPDECVGDALLNGVRDVADIMSTARQSQCQVYLPLVAAHWRQPWPTPSPNTIVLSDGPGGLDLVSAPATLPITVGHVTYLPIEVQGHHRAISVSAQTLIHTYVNDATPAEPGDSAPFAVGTLQGSQDDTFASLSTRLKLQTLRMRSHPLTLTFSAVGQVGNLSHTLTLTPSVQPRAPLFGAGFIPGCPTCYWGALSEPYDRVYGPDCRPCDRYPGDPPGTTRNIRCVKANHLGPCDCRPIQEVFNAEEANRIRTTHALAIQRYASQILRHQIGWSDRQPYPTTIINPYTPATPSTGLRAGLSTSLLEGLGWIFQLPPQERDYSPLINDFMEGIGGWMSCPDDYPMVVNTGSGGSVGFYDENNAAMVNEYRRYVRELATRFGPELRFLETVNEPCYSFYLCPCRGQEDQPGYACDQTWSRGPDHRVCDDLPPGTLQPHETQEFADVYAEFLFAAADVAAEELQNAGSDALLVAGALELTGAGLTKTTEKMIRLGLLERDNVAFMIHQFPYPGVPNWIEHAGCAYGPGWSLPDGCETAPPFQNYTTPAGRPVAAHDMWQAVDEAIDVSEILSDVVALSQEPDLPDDLLSRFYLFDSELHGGFAIKDETTNAGRTAIAGLRIGAINAHQRFTGSLFIGNNTDPVPYNVMVKHLAGVEPVYRWDAPLIGSDYAGLVYKLFTRGDEDIIAVWSNAATPTTLDLTLAGGPTQFKGVRLTRVFGPECPTVDCRGLSEAERTRVDVSSTQLSSPPAGITVAPLQEFYFLSVISDRPGFGWLAGIAAHGSS